MPNVNKRTLFVAFGEALTTIITASLLSASVNSNTLGDLAAPVIKSKLIQYRSELSTFSPIIDSDIQPDIEQIGKGSWYGGEFHKRKTASGERFDMYGFTAAHRSLPFGTIVRITDLTTEKTVLVCINDRGPFIRTKIIDLSKKAAQSLGGTLKNLKLEAYLPGKALASFDAENKDEPDTIVGFGADMQLKSLIVEDDALWSYTETFSDAISIQKELTSRFPDHEAIISPANLPSAEGRYAVFLVPMSLANHQAINRSNIF